MTAEENEIFREAILLQKSTNWWINQTSKIIQKIDDLEKQDFSLENESELEDLRHKLGTFLARKKIEEKKIEDLLVKIDKVEKKGKGKKCQN
jgi:predicted  nucleic acid-binding Zn-ribbon protein